MREQAFAVWEKTYRAAAEKDHYTILRTHLERFELGADPMEVVETTIKVVRACSCHYMVDGRSFETLLSKQTYDPKDMPDMTYSFTFVLHNEIPSRLLLATKRATIDLVDLFDHLWEDKTVGFDGIIVSRNDGTDLSNEEIDKIEGEVLDDFYCDYGEDEIDVYFDASRYPGNLHIYAYEADN